MCNCTSEVWSFGPSRNDELPDTVETMIAIVVAAAAVAAPPAAIRNPEHALDRPHRAADAGTNRAANRAGDPVAFIGPLLRAAHDTLGMTDMGDREQCQHDCRSRKMEFCRQAGGRRRCPDLCLHLEFLLLGRDWPDRPHESVP